jgi:hypothetical protein
MMLMVDYTTKNPLRRLYGDQTHLAYQALVARAERDGYSEYVTFPENVRVKHLTIWLKITVKGLVAEEYTRLAELIMAQWCASACHEEPGQEDNSTRA